MKNLELKMNLTSYQKKQCEEYFNLLKEGDYIYPGYLKSKMFTEIEVVYKLLETLKNEGYLVKQYEVYCKNCCESKGVFLNSISEFNADIYCDFCNKPMNALDNLVILYKVIAL